MKQAREKLQPTGSRTIRKSRKTAPKDEFTTIHRLAEELQALNQEAVRAYTPVVDAIVRSGSCDIRTIEHTLDGLLGFCGHDPALQLYKILCRHYYAIDPAATTEYVHSYREMWDAAPSDQPSPLKKHRQKAAAKAMKRPGKKGEGV